METNKKFKDAEDKGRTLFTEIIAVQDWCTFKKFAKNQMSVWDVVYLSGGTYIIGEIKVRTYPSTYDDWYLQKSKFNDLKAKKIEADLATGRNYQIQYINFFNDGVCRIWTITDVDQTLNTVETFVGKTTMGDTTKVNKYQYELKNNDAVFTTKYGHNC